MDAVGGIREVGMRRGRKRMVSIFLRYFLLIGIGVVILYTNL